MTLPRPSSRLVSDIGISHLGLIQFISMRFAKAPKQRVARSLMQIEVYNLLKGAVLGGKFRPGTVLSIRKLADQLKVSTMPVRDAVARLVSEKALEMRSNHGVRVPILTRVLAHEIYEARVALEGLAAANAAQHIDMATLLRLEDIQRDLESSAERTDMKGVLRHNLRFHSALIRAARSETLVALTDSLYLQWVPTLVVSIEEMWELRTEFIHTHHSAILQALRDRDPDAARRALEKDLFKPNDSFISTLERKNTRVATSRRTRNH